MALFAGGHVDEQAKCSGLVRAVLGHFGLSISQGTICRAPTTSTRLSWTRRRRRWSASSSWRWRGSPSGLGGGRSRAAAARRWRPPPRAGPRRDRSACPLRCSARERRVVAQAGASGTTRGTRCWTRSTACTPPSRASRRVGSTNPPCATPGRRRRFRSSFSNGTRIGRDTRLEKQVFASRTNSLASAAAKTTTTRTRASRGKKKREAFARGSARRSPSWTRRSPAGAVPETPRSSFARGGGESTASLWNDAEATLAAALARPQPWAMGGANADDASRCS